MMSNCTRMTGHSWSYRLLNVKLTIFFVKLQVWWQRRSNSPHFISTSISVCKAQSFNMFIHFFPPRWAISIFTIIVPFKTPNCSERRSFQILGFWQLIGKWLGIAYRDWWGNKMWWIWCFLSSNMKFHKKILSISRSTAGSFKNVQSFACNLTSFESKVIYKALGVIILSKW